jgi:hypothetical protein
VNVSNFSRTSGVVVALLSALMSLHAVADTKLSAQDKPASGFLSDYSLLKPVKGPEGTKIHRYTKSDFDPLSYSAVMIEPVIINQAHTDEKITPQIIEQTRAALDASIHDRLGQSKLKIVHEPGPNVLRVSVALSGAELDGEGFKPRNILPISAVLKAASYAVGKEEKTPVLLVESKITDSQSGTLLRAGMITISGEAFRDEARTGAEFQSLAQRIVAIAMDNSDQ